MDEMQIHFIVTEMGNILTKKQYEDWHEIQDDWYDVYKASLGPWSPQDMLDYLKDDFNLKTDDVLKISTWFKSESTIFLDWAYQIDISDRYYYRPYSKKLLGKGVK